MRKLCAVFAIIGLAALGVPGTGVAPAGAEGVKPPVLGDDGLYHHDWFLESFLNLGDDLGESAGNGKRLVVVFEQVGCGYCKQVNTVVLVDPEVNRFVRENFNVVQLNLWGDREVTDLDGKAMPEKELARKWGVLFTPTFVFLPESREKASGRSGREAAVAMMPGAFGKGTFLDLFRWVREKGYETDEPFQKYHIRMIEKRQAARTN
ncbi:MAG: thioredoxin fold domain-containing protein [Hyphomicrobiales bacterium]|nr:thioredoxin fold domain-containing protein [Hyphomicrobiales bacterium]